MCKGIILITLLIGFGQQYVSEHDQHIYAETFRWPDDEYIKMCLDLNNNYQECCEARCDWLQLHKTIIIHDIYVNALYLKSNNYSIRVKEDWLNALYRDLPEEMYQRGQLPFPIPVN